MNFKWIIANILTLLVVVVIFIGSIIHTSKAVVVVGAETTSDTSSTATSSATSSTATSSATSSNATSSATSSTATSSATSSTATSSATSSTATSSATSSTATSSATSSTATSSATSSTATSSATSSTATSSATSSTATSSATSSTATSSATSSTATSSATSSTATSSATSSTATSSATSSTATSSATSSTATSSATSSTATSSATSSTATSSATSSTATSSATSSNATSSDTSSGSDSSTIDPVLLDIISGCVQREIVGTNTTPNPAYYEAYKAQAIATHTFYLFNNKPTLTYTTPDPIVVELVREVFDEFIYYNGSLINSTYHAASGGYTESSQNVWGGIYPYLQSVPSSYDDYLTTYTISSTNFSKALSTYGVELSQSSPELWFDLSQTTYFDSGSVDTLWIDGNMISARVLREQILGNSNLYSTKITDIVVSGDQITFHTKGYGHGVGLSQVGALGYSYYEGWTYKQILEHYYSGTSIY